MGLSLPEPEIARKFYSAFGLDVAEDKGRLVARCDGRAQDQVVVREGQRRGLDYLSFGGRASDLAAARQNLEARGVKLLDPPTAMHRVKVYGLEISTETSFTSGPSPPAATRAALAVNVNTSSTVVRINQRGCPPFGMQPKPIRLGHVILFSPDPSRKPNLPGNAGHEAVGHRRRWHGDFFSAARPTAITIY